ncbi:hypothetical protein BpHYR1_013979 [Brachionus plicatilis]|uniref:Uncharacterized protein n=1 Tax=Brachionus plicatilis TaxID=10195 RepID=A0A3M7SSB9_BRAPC|nr:hypothetical protein BpHYR1_013979 [Brachionus plicatilis]
MIRMFSLDANNGYEGIHFLLLKNRHPFDQDSNKKICFYFSNVKQVGQEKTKKHFFIFVKKN